MSTMLREGLHVLRSDRTAARSTDAFPVGNGMRGASCQGRTGAERLWLNVDIDWEHGEVANVRLRSHRHTTIEMSGPGIGIRSVVLTAGQRAHIEPRGNRW